MKSPILLAIPGFLILIGIELLYSYRRGKKLYRLNDTIANLSLGIGNQVVNILAKGLLVLLFLWVYRHFAIFSIAPGWWSFVSCLLLFDFLFYWAHRLSHEVNFLWGSHVVHHQSEEYNLSVALRQPWFQDFVSFYIFLPVPLLGFHPKTILLAGAVHTIYQFWIHTRAIGKMPKLIEFFFNTPSHHRVHHAVNPRYIDKNHAGVFIIWDRLFGTFQEEGPQEVITYGTTTQFRSWNPVWANMEYYAFMWEKARRMKHWKDRLQLIFARPGWMPESMGGFQKPKEVDLATYRKYDEDSSPLFRAYAAVQFIITLAGTVVFLDHYSGISVFYRLLFAAILLLSILIVSGIFEQKRWVPRAEIARLVLVLISLNSYYYYWYKNWLAIMEGFSVALFIVFIGWLLASMYYESQEKASIS